MRSGNPKRMKKSIINEKRLSEDVPYAGTIQIRLKGSASLDTFSAGTTGSPTFPILQLSILLYIKYFDSSRKIKIPYLEFHKNPSKIVFKY